MRTAVSVSVPVPVPCTLFDCLCANSTQDKREQADSDCRLGPVHVLLARYDTAQSHVTLWSEPVHQIRANYYVDPWNQGVRAVHGLCVGYAWAVYDCDCACVPVFSQFSYFMACFRRC